MVAKKNKYVVLKKNNHQKVNELKISSYYDMNFKNKIDDGININKIRIINQNFIQKILDKKINKRFKSLLELIASICESDEDPSSGLMFALSETERFKREMINKYNRLLKKEQREFIDKKIEVIEKEVKKRLYEHQLIIKCQQKLMEEAMFQNLEQEEVMENHRRR